tara:strand:- start:1506 stop:1742 length:237 start_codon:yes stop_codon:yes gene_type:complete
MKINRTFSIDYTLARRLKDEKHNQSAIVEAAVQRYLDADEDFSIGEVSTQRIMSVLYYRKDTPQVLKAVLKVILHIDD